MNGRPPLLRYGVPVLAVAAAMLLRWPLWGILQGELAFLFLWPVVLLCAWYGGLGPGLLATALSATAAAFFLLEPRFSVAVATPADLVGLLVFVSVNVAISFLCEKLHDSRRRSERQAEEVARQREWLRVSLESIGDAVIATDTEGRVSFLNPTAEALTGWGQQDSQGQPLEDVFRIVNEPTRQPVGNPVARVIREGVVVGLANHIVLVASDGTERPVEVSAAPVKDDGGRVVGVILVLRDVTRKLLPEKAPEERRREQTAQLHFRTLFESAPGLFLVLKPDLTIAAVSDAYLAATMTRREDILGRGLFDVFPDNPDDPAATGVRNLRASLDRVRQSRAADAMAVQKYDIRRPDSEGGGFEERHWSPVNAPVLGPGGEIEYIIHRVEDVTEFVRRKQRDTQRDSDAAALRTRTEQVEAEVFLRGQQLQQVNERLRAANEALAAEVAERTRAEDALRRLHDGLERQVQDRTAALTVSNEALRESEERFRAAFDRAAVGVGLVGMDGRTLWFNRGLSGMLGYGEAEFGGLTFADVTHPDDLGADLDLQRRVAAGGFETARYEKRYVHRDGHTVWGDLSVSLVRDAAGGPKYIVGVVVDITHRKAAESALRDSEERFRTLADSIPQLAWTARPDGHIYWYNRRWYEYTGTTLEQMEGWGWQSVHDPEELPRVLDRWKASIATGEPFDMVFPLKGKDGVFRPFLTRVMPLRSGGRILQWFGTNTDISEIKAMEEKLKEADRRKDQFVMMLAHELRNPLAPIRNGLQLLQASQNDGQVVEQARRIMVRQVGHMARIIEDLLDVSRLMRGRVELRPERIDLGRLARTVVEDERAAFDKAGVFLEADLPELPAWVNVDPTRLTQVVANLLQNAAKFTDRGGTVSVWVRPDAGRQQVVLAVRDTGVGIEPGLLPHLFETFTQADRSLDRSKGGLGLGLSLVKGLVGLHGGEVHAVSDGPGRGAEFVVRLPIQPEPAAITRMPEAPKRAGKKLRILVVEDNRDAADSLKMLLELFGYEVNVAYCGPSGVEAAKEWEPDVILCDIGLPGLDGYGVARALRQNPTTAKARMIAVTGYGGDEDRLKSRQAGFDGHLTKPADPTTLQELLAVETTLP